MNLKLSFRIWLLIFLLALSLISIFGIPPLFLQHGVIIRSVAPNSTASQQGLAQGQVITAIDGSQINDVSDFSAALLRTFPTNESKKMVFTTTSSQVIYYSNETPQITVSDTPTTNLKLGLDLVGGARALVQANGTKLSQSQVNEIGRAHV